MKHRKLIRVTAIFCMAAVLAGSGTAAVNLSQLTNAAGANGEASASVTKALLTPKEVQRIQGLVHTGMPSGRRNSDKQPSMTEEVQEEVKFSLPMLENAVRQYLGLEETDTLTSDLLKGITSITFSRSEYSDLLNQTAYEGKTAVKIAFNHGALPGVAEFEGIDAYAYEALPRTIRTKYFDLSAITDEWLFHKFRSFYTVKDPADPMLDAQGIAELTARYPNTQVSPLAILDPMAKPRELKELFVIADTYGLVNTDTFIDGKEIAFTDADAAYFPDLEIVEFKDGFDTAARLTAVETMHETVMVEEILP